jgi:hypothetical protein
VIRDNPLAPVMHQAQASSLAMAMDILGEAPLKTQSFRRCQSVSAPKMISEFSPLTLAETELTTLLYQSWKVVS